MLKNKKYILLIEDNPGDARLVAEALKPSPRYNLKTVECIADAVRELENSNWNAILLDLSLPDSEGLEAIKLLRGKKLGLAVVVLTGTDQTEVAVNALKEGADDFLSKNRMNPEVLERSLRYAIKKKQSEVERDLFFSVSLDLICVAGFDGYFKRINPACIDILGYTPEEMYARPMIEFLHPDDLESTVGEISRQAKGIPALSFENRYRCKNGSYKDLSWKSVPVGDKMYATARDITEQKMMKNQLLHADRMAAVGTLAAGVAHEINNPLCYSLTNLSLILEDLEKVDPDDLLPDKLNSIRKKVVQALDGIVRVKDVVNGLKIFSRNDEEKKGPVNLEYILNSAINMAMHEIQPRAKLIKKFSATPLVTGNEGRLGQVFLNLLINAAQAIPEGNAENESITLRMGTDSEGRALIELEDTGVGMSEATKARIFDPFFTTKPVGLGTGLGLSICHGIVTSFGGTIAVDSKLGKGASFKITLPKSIEAPREEHEDEIFEVQNKRRLKILVVDDEILLAETIVAMIGNKHDAEMNCNSRKALDLILKHPKYDLIFCDLMMPGLTGMDIYEKLKKDGRGLETRLIFMTGGAFTPKAVEFLQKNENIRLEKPFNVKTFRSILDNFKESVSASSDKAKS
ncbi:MAG: response regulator [Bdellovibrionia bacterium]